MTVQGVEQAVVARSSVVPYGGPVRTSGTSPAERPTWIIDHAAERLSEVLNQPVPVPHPHRRKDDA